MFVLEITDSAERDLDLISDYLGVHLSNPSAALTLLDEIELTCGTLRENPKAYPLCRDDRLASLGYRKALVRAYIMVYEIDAEEEKVRILRVFHSSEDYQHKL